MIMQVHDCIRLYKDNAGVVPAVCFSDHDILWMYLLLISWWSGTPERGKTAEYPDMRRNFTFAACPQTRKKRRLTCVRDGG